MKVKCLIMVLGMALLSWSCSDSSTEDVQKKDKLSSLQYEMFDIAELGSVEYTIKQIISDKQTNMRGQKSILFGWVAYVKAGIDLNGFSEDDVEVNDIEETVCVTLPHAKILSVNIPSDSIKEIYHHESVLRSKGYDAEERNEVLIKGQVKLDSIIQTLDVLSEAEANTKQLFEDMLVRKGFERQNVKVKFASK